MNAAMRRTSLLKIVLVAAVLVVLYALFAPSAFAGGAKPGGVPIAAPSAGCSPAVSVSA
jgi:hypothetical protein